MIKELEDKYFVLKGKDIGEFLSKDEMFQLHDLSMKISEGRKAVGKKDNRYLVLNLDDEIDVNDNGTLMTAMRNISNSNGARISHIALAIVNSIKGD